MAGMGDGYVGTAQDAVRIRRLQKQREVEKRKIQELKNKSASAGGQTGLLQFGSGTSEVPFIVFLSFNLGFLLIHHLFLFSFFSVSFFKSRAGLGYLICILLRQLDAIGSSGMKKKTYKVLLICLYRV